MQDAYLGNPEQANRLHAARRTAGFKSGRQAALHFGWSASTYCAHETATRYLPDAAARTYALAFGVKPDWLIRGAGDGPEVDQIRALRFDAKRAAKKQRLQDDPTMQAHRRLRLARRLAGYVSTTDAAAETGLKRTTLSAHETGQNSISQKMARLYGQAFGVSPAWLLTGETPSGYPLETERRLPHLVNSFDEADREAREALADWIKPVKRQIETITEPPASKVQFEKNQTETVPEISGRNVFRCIEEGSFSEIFSEQAWSFPKGYLAEVLGAASPSVVIISPSVDLALPHRGERLIVDTSARVRLPDRLYVWVNKIGRFWTNDGSEVDADWLMVGWVCGRIGRT